MDEQRTPATTAPTTSRTHRTSRTARRVDASTRVWAAFLTWQVRAFLKSYHFLIPPAFDNRAQSSLPDASQRVSATGNYLVRISAVPARPWYDGRHERPARRESICGRSGRGCGRASRYPLPAGGPCGCGRKQRDLRFLPRWSIGTWLLAAVVSAAIKAHRAGETEFPKPAVAKRNLGTRSGQERHLTVRRE